MDTGIKTIDIIVPCYNEEEALDRSAELLLNKLHQLIGEGLVSGDSRIVFVDDGSKEECSALCDELAKNDTRIKVIHKKNEGQGIARNCGIEASCGEYIGFVDSDDYVDITMYENLYLVAK